MSKPAKEPESKAPKYSIAQLPLSMMSEELEGIYGARVLAELNEIIDFYNTYDAGADFPIYPQDYIPADLRYKIAKKLIDEEARFLFAKPPDFTVKVSGDNQEVTKKQQSTLQAFLNAVLKKNNFNQKILRAARDCFIGRRVAYTVNFNAEKGIAVNFSPSLEFVYDTDPADASCITKLVLFYTTVDAADRKEQVVYKKKYWLENGAVYVEEGLYSGHGALKEELMKPTQILFDSIPGGVILNDGLTGDMSGISEIEVLQEYEAWYSRLANADKDALRKSMNPIKWARDMKYGVTKDLSGAAGAFWDLTTDPAAANSGRAGEVGVLESNMAYSQALGTTLNRTKTTMYGLVDVPDVSPEALKGIISSGKTLKAIYWPLIVRCDEKMQTWQPALETMAQTIIEGGRVYPEAAKRYIGDELPNVEFEIIVNNQYPLPEDEQEEKATDMAEVAAGALSRKAYMKKWHNATDDDAEAEIMQIAKERAILEDSFPMTPPVDSTLDSEPAEELGKFDGQKEDGANEGNPEVTENGEARSSEK